MLSALAADRTSLAALKSQIANLEQSLALLHLEASQVKRRLDAYSYPVLTLPDEIVSEIFIHFLPPYPACPPLAGLDAPVLLTHICRRWRAIAIATPQLWQAVSFSGVGSTIFNPNNIWLTGRSGCCPLSIRMLKKECSFYGLERLFAAILPYHAQWEYLRLQFESHWMNSLPAIEDELPRLRHLDLEVFNHIFWNFELPHAPLLSSAVLNVIAAHSVVLPWTQLTFLCLHRITLDNCETILRKVPNLVECYLDLFVDDFDFTIQPRITLPRLQSLRLNGDGGMNGCLDAFTLPALTALDVCEWLIELEPVDDITSLLSRSACTLRHLCIMGATHDDTYRTAFSFIQDLHLKPADESDFDSSWNVHLIP
ncbi:F-box domain-containing protein [Favolaschia claudopus]|uniref:F-box domain-containing protein n=1 Tax=Favolaschia claudopus TaxID=2862362 RepID=A0AAW0AYD9_9AGAR